MRRTSLVLAALAALSPSLAAQNRSFVEATTLRGIGPVPPLDEYGYAVALEGGVRLALPHGELVIAGEPLDAEGDLAVVVHPKDIALSLERPAGTARNVFEGTIEEIAPEPPAGDLVRIAVASSPRLTAEVTREAVESLGLHTGARVYASFKAAGVTVVADASGMNGWS